MAAARGTCQRLAGAGFGVAVHPSLRLWMTKRWSVASRSGLAVTVGPWKPTYRPGRAQCVIAVPHQ